MKEKRLVVVSEESAVLLSCYYLLHFKICSYTITYKKYTLYAINKRVKVTVVCSKNISVKNKI